MSHVLVEGQDSRCAMSKRGAFIPRWALKACGSKVSVCKRFKFGEFSPSPRMGGAREGKVLSKTVKNAGSWI